MESEIAPGLVTGAGDQVIRANEKLMVVKASCDPTPTKSVWIHEDMIEDARRLWELGKRID